jgi:sulfite reductase (NADPH) flavoprotein alpha-component
VLADFRSARLGAQDFIDQLRRLNPRLYSVASSARVHPDEVHLTIVVVRYTMNGRERSGVCSSFLADRVKEYESLVPVFLVESHFAPPEDPSRDCIMIGPGTGIAPFRAFLQDRAALQAPGRNWLFFGDQRRASDYLYEEEWDEALRKGLLQRLDLAWSRDQEHKVYVQDKMRENASELWSWIRGGAQVSVCGDAKRMARDVDLALHEIVAREGRMDPAAAADYIRLMKREKRYQRDVY